MSATSQPSPTPLPDGSRRAPPQVASGPARPPGRPRTEPLLSELRRRHPRDGLAADHGRSAAAAIKLKCLDCASGSRAEVRDCASLACPLWRFRPFGEQERCDGVVPTRDEYAALIDAAASDAQREARRRGGERLRIAQLQADADADTDADDPEEQ